METRGIVNVAVAVEPDPFNVSTSVSDARMCVLQSMRVHPPGCGAQFRAHLGCGMDGGRLNFGRAANFGHRNLIVSMAGEFGGEVCECVVGTK